jgi:hypothetical protein
VYICGGPYDAAEELRTEFEGLVPDDVIEELENELFSRFAETARTKDLSSRVNSARQLTPYLPGTPSGSPKHLFRLHERFHVTLVLGHSYDRYFVSLNRFEFPRSLLGCKRDASWRRPRESPRSHFAINFSRLKWLVRRDPRRKRPRW